MIEHNKINMGINDRNKKKVVLAANALIFFLPILRLKSLAI